MGEHKCVVNSCCCGCSLRGGSLAIAVVNLILALIVIVLASLALVQGIIVVWPQIVGGVIRVIISAILIYGINKESRGMVMAWVWTVSILTCISLIFIIVLLVMGAPFMDLLGDIIGVFLNIYFIIVVRSFAFKLGTPEAMA